MAKKKSKQPSGGEGAQFNANGPAVPSPMTQQPSQSQAAPASAARRAPAIPSSPASLVICRNKHWRYISSFHGTWLQMPLELLESIANINYNTPSPRPIDAAAFFDLVKVRRLVDEATSLTVRAASGIASPTLTNVNDSFPSISSMNSLGTSPGHGAKLSRERKFRMREQASQKLARAYRLDEIVCSVATMQGASPLEEVGGLVLQRNPRDPDAKYVHFFHEKIPSRQLAESTSLEPLSDIISDRPGEPEVLRTRATVKIFKEDLEGAIVDLTHALSVSRFIRAASHKTGEESMQVQEPQRNRKRPHDVILSEKDQPSSLDGQLLFQRASVYLTLACQHVLDGIPTASLPQAGQVVANGSGNGAAGTEANGKSTPEPDKEKLKRQAEMRKLVKSFAKRAIKDYMSFISHFEYSPDLPIKIANEFNERVNLVAHGIRSSRSFDSHNLTEPHTVYPVSDLFSAVPPAGLPPYPSQEVVKHGSRPPSPPVTSCEWATYHPLLPDALHSLLLCHCLAQTSSKELQRHAHMVARLIRLSDGYPVFQASRSPARADWVEVIRRAENWLQLSSSWEDLCAPAPLPLYDAEFEQKPAPCPNRAASAAAALINGGTADTVAEERREERRKERIREQAIMDALDDERVIDEASFRAAIEAREKRAEQEHNLFAGKSANGGSKAAVTSAAANVGGIDAAMRRWSAEDGMEYPILTDRAAAIALWVQEAPVVTGTAKRKKPTKRADAKVRRVVEGVCKLEPGQPAAA